MEAFNLYRLVTIANSEKLNDKSIQNECCHKTGRV